MTTLGELISVLEDIRNDLGVDDDTPMQLSLEGESQMRELRDVWYSSTADCVVLDEEE